MNKERKRKQRKQEKRRKGELEKLYKQHDTQTNATEKFDINKHMQLLGEEMRSPEMKAKIKNTLLCDRESSVSALFDRFLREKHYRSEVFVLNNHVSLFSTTRSKEQIKQSADYGHLLYDDDNLVQVLYFGLVSKADDFSLVTCIKYELSEFANFLA